MTIRFCLRSCWAIYLFVLFLYFCIICLHIYSFLYSIDVLFIRLYLCRPCSIGIAPRVRQSIATPTRSMGISWFAESFERIFLFVISCPARFPARKCGYNVCPMLYFEASTHCYRLNTFIGINLFFYSFVIFSPFSLFPSLCVVSALLSHRRTDERSLISEFASQFWLSILDAICNDDFLLRR